MRRASAIVSVLLVLGLSSFAQPGGKNAGRLVTGKVMDRQDNPVTGAVVYLTNTRTRSVKTYIVAGDGAYRFPSLSSEVDYELYAQAGGRKSDTKSVSQFDNRPQVVINLHIDNR
jgi:hypothetical protein